MQLNPSIPYQKVLRHLLFWLTFSVYQTISKSLDESDELFFQLAPQLLTYLPVAVSLTYLNLYVLMPAYYNSQHYIRYAISVLVLLLVGGLVERYFFYTIWVPREQLSTPFSSATNHYWIPVRILRNAIKFFPLLGVTTLIKLMERAYQRENTLRQVEAEKFSAELGLLKAQLNPHFFFNTLNSLYALTLKRSELASAVVLRLSDLMQYVLYEARSSKVLLADEIRHLENYTSIEQLRFADRLELSFQASGDIAGKQIAPLLLLPFVENAFKHGLVEQAGWITIHLKVINGRLFLKVDNSYRPTDQPSRHGLGLKTVQRRLDLLYGGRYELQLNQHDDMFEADLKLDL